MGDQTKNYRKKKFVCDLSLSFLLWNCLPISETRADRHENSMCVRRRSPSDTTHTFQKPRNGRKKHKKRGLQYVTRFSNRIYPKICSLGLVPDSAPASFPEFHWSIGSAPGCTPRSVLGSAAGSAPDTRVLLSALFGSNPNFVRG